MKSLLTIITSGLYLFFCAGARGVLIDEIQVYDNSINTPQQFGLELHVNTTPSGRSSPDYQGEITPQHGIRITAEFSYGLNKAFELGLYVPSVFTPDHQYVFPGYKVRLKWMPIHPEDHNGWFLGSNGELSDLSPEVDQTRWSFELRNIGGWRNEDWEIASNVVFDWPLSGENRAWRPDFEIDIKIARKIIEGVAFGPEYYADFGKLGRPDRFPQQAQALYAAFDVDLKPFVFNFGVGRGVTHSEDRWTVKAIFEIPW